ncbi:MAG: hypothetical protein QNJ36_20225 [Calothrix sp. MO_167.B42]|nr:hypothetical protein [Calothrix sp. MO_167.B42]
MKLTDRQKSVGAIALFLFCFGVVMNQQGMAGQRSIGKKDTTTNLLQKHEIAEFQALMGSEIQTTLGLAGLGKIAQPPKLPVTLKLYRAKWSKVDPEIAPFLGFWVNYWELFEPYFAIAIFPSTIKGQVCLIEYQDNGHHYTPPPGETLPPNPPPRFSTVTIVKGQALSSKLQTHKSLIIHKGEIEFIGTIKGEQKLQVYASQSIAKLDSQISPQIMQQFNNHKCSKLLPS